MDARSTKEKLVDALLENGATKREVFEMVAAAVHELAPEADLETKKALGWAFVLDLNKCAQERKAL